MSAEPVCVDRPERDPFSVSVVDPAGNYVRNADGDTMQPSRSLLADGTSALKFSVPSALGPSVLRLSNYDAPALVVDWRSDVIGHGRCALPFPGELNPSVDFELDADTTIIEMTVEQDNRSKRWHIEIVRNENGVEGLFTCQKFP